MNILIISPLPPGIGGVSVSSQRLIFNLKADGYDVDSYNIRYRKQCYNNPFMLAIRFFWIPFYILFSKKYDIIHCHVPGILRKLYIILFKIFYKNAKIIFTIHGDINNIISSKLFIFSVKKANGIICVQPKDSLKLPENLKIKSIDIPAFILPTIINLEYIPQDVVDFCKKKGSQKLIIFNGAMIVNNQWKDLYGFIDMFESFKVLIEKGENLRMLMILNGIPKNQEESSCLIKLKNAISNYTNIKFVEKKQFELCPLFKYADVYVRPTKTDGDSLSIREALAMHCKTVASDVTKRPKDVILYHDKSELPIAIIQALRCSNFTFNEQKDYYEDIKNAYYIFMNN